MECFPFCSIYQKKLICISLRDSFLHANETLSITIEVDTKIKWNLSKPMKNDIEMNHLILRGFFV
jgi:hypothetical protein